MEGYSICDLLRFLLRRRGDNLRLETGFAPTLTIEGEEYEIEGPALAEEEVEGLLRVVASSREMRSFWHRGMLDAVYSLGTFRFLVHAERGFGRIRLDVHAMKA